VLYAGVFAGWLMALLAWLLASARSTGAQIALIWLCTFPISALGFRHSIAGSVEAFYLAAAGQLNYGQVAAKNRGGQVDRRTGGQNREEKSEKPDLGAW
jgi:formate/nitrite transporter FocA (FNT family)